MYNIYLYGDRENDTYMHKHAYIYETNIKTDLYINNNHFSVYESRLKNNSLCKV